MGKEKFKADMMLSEAIEEAGGMFQLTRQRNLNRDEVKWYGLSLFIMNDNDFEKWDGLAVNEDWILDVLSPMLTNKEYKDAMVALEIDNKCNKNDLKPLRRIFKTARSLGWFDKYISEHI